MAKKKCVSDIAQLMGDWDWEKNSVSPYEISYGSAKRCHWKCSDCGHRWATPVYSRGANGCGCPVCAKTNRGITKKKSSAKKNSFLHQYPAIAKEWHPAKNQHISIEDISAFSNVRVWWKCSVCEYEWATTVHHRTKENNGCPMCAKQQRAREKVRKHADKNNFAAKFPELVVEWDAVKNGELKPEDVSVSCNKKVWWKCSFCGYGWFTTVNHRTSGEGCPSCSKAQTSLAEQTVFFYVSKVFPDAINRYKEEFEFDIFIPSRNVAIEYDGAFYHKTAKKLNRDNLKDRYCKEQGVALIRFRSQRLLDTESAFRITCEEHQLKTGIESLFQYLSCNCPSIDIERDRLEILQKMRQTKVENSVGKKFPSVAREWHATKNASISPLTIPAMSNNKFWWKCEQCGYEWQDSPSHRCGRGSGCPYCAGKVVIEGKNDLATLQPEVAKEWHAKNALKPTEVSAGSSKKVWWVCSICGHEWETVISCRKQPGCSNCSRKRK